MLRENNSCNFGVIDIDIRGDVKLNESLESLEEKIRSNPIGVVQVKVWWRTFVLVLRTCHSSH